MNRSGDKRTHFPVQRSRVVMGHGSTSRCYIVRTLGCFRAKRGAEPTKEVWKRTFGPVLRCQGEGLRAVADDRDFGAAGVRSSPS